MKKSMLLMFVTTIVLGGPSSARAVKKEVWRHEQPKDFTSGKLDGVVVTSLGEVMLTRAIRELEKPQDDEVVINALAQAGDGVVYAATGPKGVIYRVDGDEVSEFARLPDEAGSIFSLVFAKDGKLLAGTGGEQAIIYRIDGNGKASVFHKPEGATYVWAMVRGADGEIFAATGIEGKLFRIEPDGEKAKVLADLKIKNVLCLAAGADGQLYAGTDEQGLIYRIHPKSGKTFVLHDAKEAEISAIVLDGMGNVYAATAAADAARPGREIPDKTGGTPDAASKPANGADDDEDDGAGDDSGDSDEEYSEAQKEKLADTATQQAIDQIFADARSIGRSASTKSTPKEGNAVYRVSRDGFVTEVFREPVMVLAMAEAGGTLYLATGNEGRIYTVDPARERTTQIARLEVEQGTTLLELDNGELLIGSANAARLFRVSSDYASEGKLTSTVLDAGQAVKWGRVLADVKTPKGTTVTIQTRTGNVEDDESDEWEDWSIEMDASEAQQIPSATARFLQYRVQLRTADSDVSPSLSKVLINRIQENRAPQVTSIDRASVRDDFKDPKGVPKIKATFGAIFGNGKVAANTPDHQWVVKWKGEDPNQDTLIYDVYFRAIGDDRWIRTLKDTAETHWLWDTRTVPDGDYEVRVLAKDIRANPPGIDLVGARISDPIRVDNTAPEVNIEKTEPRGNDGVEIRATVFDDGGIITDAAYSVDSNDKWIPLAPEDDIFDAPREAVSFTVSGLSAGEHRIAIRVTDSQHNTRYVTKTISTGG